MVQEISKPNPASASVAPTKKRNKTLLIVAVAVVITIVATLLVANAMIQGQPTANIQATSWSISQSATGPTTFTVTVQNTGGAGGDAVVSCDVHIPGAAPYSGSKTVYVTEGGTQTVTVVVDTPFGTAVTKDMCVVNVNRA